MSGRQKTAVGIFVIGGFILFALGLFWIGDRRLLFSDSIELETRFANLSGLRVGSNVNVGGMGAGEVLAVQVPPGPGEKFRVRFRVLSTFEPMLRSDSVASIQVEGLVGSKMLQVESGTPAGQPVASGTILPSREPVEISAVIQESVNLIANVNTAVEDVQKRVVRAIDTVTSVGEETEKLVVKFGADTEEILGTGKRISRDVDALISGVRKGDGLVGKLLTDDTLYPRLERTVKNVETTASNVTRISDDASKLVADIRSRNVGETLQKTAANVEQVTAQIKTALEQINPAGSRGERGVFDDVRETLVNTREATAGLAENMEALKRNWLFRGYFNRRGFFDLDNVSLHDYRTGNFATSRDRRRTWLEAHRIFERHLDGHETLTERGREILGEALVPYLRHARNTALMVEGYSGEGAEEEQFLRSRERATTVRRYLVERFGLKPNFVGTMPMGAVAAEGTTDKFWNGVSLVFFPEKE